MREEPPLPPPPPRKFTVEAIRERARAQGERVFAQFERLVKMSKDAGLAVRPFRASVMAGSPTNRRWNLMYARPRDGGLEIEAYGRGFAGFFEIAEEEAVKALPRNGLYTGEEIDGVLDQIEGFLTGPLAAARRPDDPA